MLAGDWLKLVTSGPHYLLFLTCIAGAEQSLELGPKIQAGPEDSDPRTEAWVHVRWIHGIQGAINKPAHAEEKHVLSLLVSNDVYVQIVV